MPGYKTKQEDVVIPGVADLVIRSLLDQQQYADPLGVGERLGISSAAWPMFGLLWPSAVQLAAQLATRLLQPTERILEIGCGLALASLVGHRRGADITASDCHPLAGEFLAANLRLNGLPPMKYRHGEWATVDRPGVEDLPGCEPAVRGRYELIIGSDVLYERDARDRLARFIDRHATDKAQVWIVDPDRGNRSAFNRAMAAAGFGLVETRLDQPASARAPRYRGRLLSYCRGGV